MRKCDKGSEKGNASKAVSWLKKNWELTEIIGF